jgi:acyl dehydratase/CBS domain-containing protein
MLVQIDVSEVMVTPVVTAMPEVDAREAARRLTEEHIGSLVVCSNGGPVGIVTDVDVSKLVAEGLDPESTTVGDVMTADLITVPPDAPIQTAAAKMREHEIKRLPVVDDDGVVGIVTTTDLSNFLPHLTRMGRDEEPSVERERRQIRPDTAWENDEWAFEYHGSEAQVDVGDHVRFEKTITDEDVQTFAEASGDTNRLHLDEEYAAKTRFGGRIVHGTLVTGLISAALARLPGMTIYLSQDVSYLGPVELGERPAAVCKVVEHIGNGRFRISTRVEDADGETVIDGEAVVLSEAAPE